MSKEVTGEIIEYLDRCDLPQKLLFLRLLKNIFQEVQTNVWCKSKITTKPFTRQFETILKVHHALNFEPLTKKNFEFAFLSACRADKKNGAINSDPTFSGADITVNGVAYSLKTEAATSISPSKINISKMMEARWIRECRTGEDCLKNLKKFFLPHLKTYKKIMILRVFRRQENGIQKITYRLHEIPCGLFQNIFKADEKDFSARTQNGSFKLRVRAGQMRSYDLFLDGSVEKLTVRNIPIEDCLCHASWDLSLDLERG